MADSDDGRMPGQVAQHAVERRLAILVERRRRLVEKDDGGLGEQHPREGETFLLAAREALRPIVDLVEIGREIAEPDLVEHGDQPVALDAGTDIGIGEGVAQATEWDIWFLRQEEGAALIKAHPTAAERPNSGDRAQERALAGPGRSGDQEPAALR